MNKNILTVDSGTEEMAEALFYRQYLMEHINLDRFLKRFSMIEYLILEFVMTQEIKSGEGTNTYLKEISKELQIKMTALSPIVTKLEEQGLVIWKHDGYGSEGTYVSITETGREVLKNEEAALKEHFSQIINHFGREKYIGFLQMMSEMIEVMKEEADKQEATKQGEAAGQ